MDPKQTREFEEATPYENDVIKTIRGHVKKDYEVILLEMHQWSVIMQILQFLKLTKIKPKTKNKNNKNKTTNKKT